MASRDEALLLQVSVDLRRMEKSLNQMRGITNRATKAVEDRFDKMNRNVRRSADDMSRDVRTAISAIAVTAAISSLGRYGDAWTTLRNQARQYVDVIGPVEESTRRINAIATDAGVSVASLGTTFAASARAAKALGASGDEVFAFNEAVAKGSAIANTGVAAVEGALVQLGQAIGSPKVQLGEFNSVIEGTPRLAQAFADGVNGANGSVAKLRELIASGEISGGELFQGLISQLPKLRSEFSETEATLSQSITRLQNAATEYVGTLDKTYGVSASLAGLINEVAANLDLFANAAIAAAAVIGGQGLLSAFTAVEQRLRSSKEAYKGELDALRLRASETKKVAEVQARLAVETRQAAAINQVLRDLSFEQVIGSKTLTAAYQAQEAALREVATAKTLLAAANRSAGALEGTEAQRRIAVTLATHRLNEAESRLAALRAAAPAELTAYYAANQAFGQSQQAAAAAADKLTAAQERQAVAARAAAGSGIFLNAAWKGIASFLAGPAGTIALIAAMTLGMNALGRSSASASTYLDRAESSIRKMNEALGEVTTAQTELKALNERIEELVRAQGEAARDTADIELAAINERISKNQELAGIYKEQALADLARARAQQATEGRNARERAKMIALSVPVGQGARGIQDRINESINRSEGLSFGSVTPEDWDKLLQSAIQQVRNAARAGKVLSDAEQELLDFNAQQEALKARIQSLQSIVDGKTEGSADPKGTPDPTLTATTRLQGFKTALQVLDATIQEITASQADAAEKSSAAIEAILNYARSGEIADAFAQIPSIIDLLIGGDESVLRSELTKLAKDAGDAIAVGADRVEVDFLKAWQEIAQAEQAAIAAGDANLDRFAAAYQELVDNLMSGIAAPAPYDMQQLSDKMRQLMADNAIDWTVEGEEFQRVMRDSVKTAMREGIRTGDWADSFAILLSDAVTTGLDEALNRIGDFLFQQNGPLSSLLNGAATWASSLFGRATGGSVYGGQTVMVGENGPELLRMGRGQTGQVLNASTTRKLMSGSGQTSIYAPFTVQGSVDAVTWPKVEAAMMAQRRQIMAAVPSTVNATLIDNRMQKRRL